MFFLFHHHKGLLYFNEAFREISPEFGSSMNREEALKYRQFRLKNIYEEKLPLHRFSSSSPNAELAANSSESIRHKNSNTDQMTARKLLIMLEHEVRAPSHVANPMLRQKKRDSSPSNL